MSQTLPSNTSASVPDPLGRGELKLPIQLLGGLVFWVAVLVTLCGFPTRTLGAEPVTRTFTDSQGRTIMYRYSLMDDWDPAQPRGLLMYFHGNSTASQTDMLDGDFPWMEPLAWERGLIPLVPVSPERGGDFNIGYGWRGWRDEDLLLVHELLQGGVSSSFAVDYGRIVFAGGSQGTCFLNDFVRAYGEHYGGGLLAWCGCFPNHERTWVPPPEFKDRFKIIVQATTEDHVYETSLAAYGYYRYTLGLETRGDLARAGGHCWAGDVPFDQAVDWLRGDIELAERPPEPHWERVSSLDHIQGFAVDSQGILWAARQPPWSVYTTLWRSVTPGASWEAVSRMELDAVDLDAADETLFLSTRAGVYRSDDRGVTFQLVYSEQPGQIVVDPANSLYADFPAGVYTSLDSGETWSLLLENGSVPRDPILVAQSPQIVAHHGMGASTGGEWTTFSDTPSGPVRSAAWDGSTLWAQAGGQVFRSADHGVNWTAVELPDADAVAYGASVTALGNGRLLIHGGSWTGTTWMSSDDGENWFRVFGGSGRLNETGVAAHPQHAGVFATNGTGVFSLNAAEPDGDSSGLPTDTDGDGVSNSVDAFPLDRSEYLDTDGDGVGNGLDPDDDGDGTDDSQDGAPLDRFESIDTDADGIGDGADADDDGDRVEDFFDSFPLDSTEWADTDGDGIGNRADTDDDGDGVHDIVDAFPTYAGEWLDTDDDGIGNNLDTDDDNDGLEDHADSEPLQGTEIAHLAFGSTYNNPRLDLHRVWPEVRADMHESKPSLYVYPEPSGDIQAYGFFRLGDGADPEIQFMIDIRGRRETDGGRWDRVWSVPGWKENQRNGHLAKIYIDRNDNGDLTDDGPPYQVPIYRPWFYTHLKESTTTVEVRYASGETLPYGLTMRWSFENGITVVANPGSVWVGEAGAPAGPVSVVVVDGNGDGLFYHTSFGIDRGSSDYICVDINRDLRSDCSVWNGGEERIDLNEEFTLDGTSFRAVVARSGREVDFEPVQ